MQAKTQLSNTKSEIWWRTVLVLKAVTYCWHQECTANLVFWLLIIVDLKLEVVGARSSHETMFRWSYFLVRNAGTHCSSPLNRLGHVRSHCSLCSWSCDFLRSVHMCCFEAVVLKHTTSKSPWEETLILTPIFAVCYCRILPTIVPDFVYFASGWVHWLNECLLTGSFRILMLCQRGWLCCSECSINVLQASVWLEFATTINIICLRPNEELDFVCVCVCACLFGHQIYMSCCQVAKSCIFLTESSICESIKTMVHASSLADRLSGRYCGTKQQCDRAALKARLWFVSGHVAGSM